MATRADLLWDEAAVLTTGIDKLRREIARCVGVSPYKAELQARYLDTVKRRDEIMEWLRQAACLIPGDRQQETDRTRLAEFQLLLTGSGRHGIATRSALRYDVMVSNSTFGLGDIGHAVRGNRSDRIRCNHQCHFYGDCNNLRATSDFTSRGLSFSSRELISTPNFADPPAAEEDLLAKRYETVRHRSC
jgi:hypothetical protein